MKKLFDFNTKTIVATGIGAALFTLLFMYVKVPTGIPETDIQTAYGVGSFFAALFGPIAGFLIAFIGHAISDAVQYGSPWWSWVFASGASALITGLCAGKVAPAVESGKFEKKEMTLFVLYAVLGNAVAWLLVAPVLDIVMYAEPVNTVFLQGITAFIIDAIVSVAVGAILLKAYASTKTGQGTLSKE